MRYRPQALDRHFVRRERKLLSESRAFEEEGEFGVRQGGRSSGVVGEEVGEAAASQPLLINAESSTVPMKNFGAGTPCIEEQEQIASQRVLAELVADDAVQTVEALTQIG